MKKNNIILGICIVGTIAIATGLTYFFSTHDITIADKKSFFIKNGYRYKNEKIPENFVKELDEWDNTRTMRFFLFELYEIQALSPDERVKKFNNIETRDEISSSISSFVDIGVQYKLADNYCIDIKSEGGSFVEVNCESRAIPIEKLPYERSVNFREWDNEGIYYKHYDVEKLWKEFDKQGIDNIHSQIEKERQGLIDKNPEYSMYY